MAVIAEWMRRLETCNRFFFSRFGTFTFIDPNTKAVSQLHMPDDLYTDGDVAETWRALDDARKDWKVIGMHEEYGTEYERPATEQPSTRAFNLWELGESITQELAQLHFSHVRVMQEYRSLDNQLCRLLGLDFLKSTPEAIVDAVKALKDERDRMRDQLAEIYACTQPFRVTYYATHPEMPILLPNQTHAHPQPALYQLQALLDAAMPGYPIYSTLQRQLDALMLVYNAAMPFRYDWQHYMDTREEDDDFAKWWVKNIDMGTAAESAESLSNAYDACNAMWIGEKPEGFES